MNRRGACGLVAVIVAVGCSSSPGAPRDGGAGAGGSLAGAAGTGSGGAIGTGGAAGAPSGTGGTAGGAAGTGDPNTPAVSVSLWEYAIGATTQLAPNIQVTNLSSKPFSMNGIEMRYWFTSDLGGATAVTQSTVFQGSQGVGGPMNMSVVPVSPARPMADAYLDIDFSPEPANINPGAYWDVLIYITRSDGGTYDQSNDYSYNASGTAFMQTDKITVYYKGALIYGIEP